MAGRGAQGWVMAFLHPLGQKLVVPQQAQAGCEAAQGL